MTAQPRKPRRPAGAYRAARARRNCAGAFRPSRIMRKAAERRIPSLGYETVAGGAGHNLGVKRNAEALDAIEMVPRTGADRRPGIDRGFLVRPALRGADRHRADGIAERVLAGRRAAFLARAAQRARIPYTAGTVSGIALEELIAARTRRDLVPALSARARTITGSASIWCGARKKRARMCW